ncbi:MAG: hypothetical protein JNK50_03705 [Bacteroidia bacterium]|nr:hypothetical protein [Bacteroidia bacterium]
MPFEINSYPTQYNAKRIVFWTGILFFTIYFIYCAFFYLERTVSFDAAYYSFKILHRENFNIENDRWGAFYTQLLPLLGIKCGINLKGFLFLYSISFAIWNFIFFTIILKALKNYKLAFSYLLSIILFYRYSFYYPVSEIHSTFGLMFILFALIEYLNENIITKKGYVAIIFFVLACSLLIAYTHVLAIVPILFWFFYKLAMLIENREFKPSIVLVSFLPIIILALKILLIPKDSYDASKMIGINEFKKVLTDLNNIESFQFFKEFFVNHFLVNILIFVVVILFLLLRRFWLQSLILVTGFIGLIILVIAYNTNHDSPLNYQNYYCLFGVIIGVSISQNFLFHFKYKYIFGLVLIVLSFNFYKLTKSGLSIYDRTKYIERTIENLRNREGKKFVVCAWNFDWKTVWVDWDLSFESLLLSSLENPKNSMTFFSVINTSQFDSIIKTQPKCFIGIQFLPYWFNLNTDSFNKNYFNFEDEYYQKPNTVQDWQLNERNFNSDNILIISEKEYKLLSNKQRQIEISLVNKTDSNFPSSISNEKRLWLSYHLYTKDGKLLVHDGARSIIELDIPANSSIKNGLSINLENIKKGEYLLEIDIVHEGVRWFNINSKSNLTIY